MNNENVVALGIVLAILIAFAILMRPKRKNAGSGQPVQSAAEIARLKAIVRGKNGSDDQSDSITFSEFVQYGRDTGANIVGGMPWSFQYKGRAVTHENDQCYIINDPDTGVSLYFTPDQVLVTNADGTLATRTKSA